MIIKTRKFDLLGKTFRSAVCCILLTVGASAQTTQSPPAQAITPAKRNVAGSLDALKKGNLAETDVDLLVTTGAVQAIPDLKRQFPLAEDPGRKGVIASALIRLGDKDSTWWDYLAEKAEEAVNSDAPPVVEYDSEGKLIPGPSQKFLAWAKVHSLTNDAALAKTELDMLAVSNVGDSRDPRAIPLLRQALLSPNYLVEFAGAMGLAQLQDTASIPLIIAAAEAAPADAAFGIGRALLDFHTPEAQSAAKKFWKTPQHTR